MVGVPTIDMTRVDAAALQAIDGACRDHGFFLLTGHGLEPVMESMWEQTRVFFGSPPRLKRSVMRTADNPLGYYDRELTKQKRDQKEVYDFRVFVREEDRHRMPWPGGMADFELELRDYFVASTALAQKVTALVCRAMGVPEQTLAPAFVRHTSTARLNHYPPVDPVAQTERAGLRPLGDMALHHHTDPGAITLLFQDNVGGLQTLSRDDGWVDVPAEMTAVVVNMGDSMQVWTNDRYRAAVHRVKPMQPGVSRYSIPFFYQPAADVVIAPLAGDEAPRYRPFSWREFIQGRIDDNFSDIGEDDIQIAKYRIN